MIPIITTLIIMFFSDIWKINSVESGECYVYIHMCVYMHFLIVCDNHVVFMFSTVVLLVTSYFNYYTNSEMSHIYSIYVKFWTDPVIFLWVNFEN